MIKLSKNYTHIALFGVCLLWAFTPVLAAPGGLDRVNDFAESIKSILTAVSVTVVTIAIMWAGYKFLFRHADIMECGKIILAGLLIGGAGELATYLIST